MESRFGVRSRAPPNSSAVVHRQRFDEHEKNVRTGCDRRLRSRQIGVPVSARALRRRRTSALYARSTPRSRFAASTFCRHFVVDVRHRRGRHRPNANARPRRRQQGTSQRAVMRARYRTSSHQQHETEDRRTRRRTCQPSNRGKMRANCAIAPSSFPNFSMSKTYSRWRQRKQNGASIAMMTISSAIDSNRNGNCRRYERNKRLNPAQARNIAEQHAILLHRRGAHAKRARHRGVEQMRNDPCPQHH